MLEVKGIQLELPEKSNIHFSSPTPKVEKIQFANWKLARLIVLECPVKSNKSSVLWMHCQHAQEMKECFRQ